ncbi:MAG TPA: methionine ABC transporter ATP-binding protein [Hypericibacter adhaerens]|uniref:methionine ABC transporter ATP-binding protein n=1 Tax=Hypericibacter adhaerens TaxID=2602016 RepID=UPI001245ACA3|nr:methionine ABC transporter ATP-binding protein [Hypericibacter adhaerens]HWA43546.1 methionine ABC transporter ATP-binding protein [Hypericibacter adhaerens]
MIRLRALNKSFQTGTREVVALKDVSIDVREGEILGIIGRSGAGKSTLLRCINGLERPQGGEVLVDGTNVSRLNDAGLAALRQRIGMIFQHFNLLSSRTAFGNVALPLELAGHGRAEIEARVSELLELVGLADKHDSYPARLSGGQKQRVGIARALATAPRILLCDEATSALDPETTRQILALLGDINRKLGLTIVLITHEMAVVRDLCDRMVVLDQGRIVEQGPVAEVFARPQSEVTRSLLQDVLPDLPAALAKRLSPVAQPGSQPLLRVRFSGAAAGEPVIAELARRFDVPASILHGAIEIIKDMPVGVLILALPATTAQPLATLIDYLRERTTSVELIGHVLPAH